MLCYTNGLCRGAVPSRGKPPPANRVNTKQPNHPDIEHRLRRSWNTYQKAEQTRAEASTQVNADLAAAHAAGITMYRMAKWLGVTPRAIKERLEKHDQTNPAG